jgi:3-oxoacyl-[acyl-carrier-protein] synthase II
VTAARRRAVVTGIGPITSVGTGVAEFTAALRAGKSGVRRLTRFPVDGLRATLAAEVDDWDPSAFFPPHRLKRLDRYAQFAVASSLLALEDAGFAWSREAPRADVGVSFGTALGGIANAELEHQRFIEKGPRGVNQTIALQVFGGSAHSNIAIECGFRGPGTTNSNSCASGVVAIAEAMRFIREGMADAVVAGGSEAPLSPLTFSAFDLIGTMSRAAGDPAGAYCPFDRRRGGFVMGEGACALLVEELEHARRRGAPIYCEVLGHGLSNEAYHMTTPLPGGEAVVACVRAALADAGVAPEQIDYINAHASGTRVNDSNETACIKEVFGAHARRLAVSGTKPFTGHPLGATGAIEGAMCALAIRDGFLPPTLNLLEPDPECDLDYVPNACRPARVRYALDNAFGFGGINACVVFGPPPEE